MPWPFRTRAAVFPPEQDARALARSREFTTGLCEMLGALESFSYLGPSEDEQALLRGLAASAPQLSVTRIEREREPFKRMRLVSNTQSEAGQAYELNLDWDVPNEFPLRATAAVLPAAGAQSDALPYLTFLFSSEFSVVPGRLLEVLNTESFASAITPLARGYRMQVTQYSLTPFEERTTNCHYLGKLNIPAIEPCHVYCANKTHTNKGSPAQTFRARFIG